MQNSEILREGLTHIFTIIHLMWKKMRRAASYLIGEHDFASFCSANAQSNTTVRTIYDCSVTKSDDIILIRVKEMDFYIIWSG